MTNQESPDLAASSPSGILCIESALAHLRLWQTRVHRRVPALLAGQIQLSGVVQPEPLGAQIAGVVHGALEGIKP
jgi:hypothetical protein